MARLRGGQAVAQALRTEGIDTVFGIVGTHNSLIFDGLTDLSDLRVVTTRHEGGAGFMADGFARATGRPAACIVVPGPGLTNVMTALGQSYLDSVPVLAIAGNNPLPTLDRRLEEFHELHGSLQIAGSVTVSARRLTSPADAPGTVREAVRLMRSGHPRPTFIEVPLDVAGAEVEVELLPPVEDYPRAGGSPEAISRAAEVLGRARRPVILAGGGAIAAEASRALQRVAARLAAPVIMAGHGRGVIPDDDPFSLGDGWGRLTYVEDLFARADATLVVGSSLDYVSAANRSSDRKSTRLNSSHPSISYAVFCLKKKNREAHQTDTAEAEIAIARPLATGAGAACTLGRLNADMTDERLAALDNHEPRAAHDRTTA